MQQMFAKKRVFSRESEAPAELSQRSGRSSDTVRREPRHPIIAPGNENNEPSLMTNLS